MMDGVDVYKPNTETAIFWVLELYVPPTYILFAVDTLEKIRISIVKIMVAVACLVHNAKTSQIMYGNIVFHEIAVYSQILISNLFSE